MILEIDGYRKVVVYVGIAVPMLVPYFPGRYPLVTRGSTIGTYVSLVSVGSAVARSSTCINTAHQNFRITITVHVRNYGSFGKGVSVAFIGYRIKLRTV